MELEKIFEERELAEELKRESRSLGIPVGSSEKIIEEVVASVCL